MEKIKKILAGIFMTGTLVVVGSHGCAQNEPIAGKTFDTKIRPFNIHVREARLIDLQNQIVIQGGQGRNSNRSLKN